VELLEAAVVGDHRVGVALDGQQLLGAGVVALELPALEVPQLVHRLRVATAAPGANALQACRLVGRHPDQVEAVGPLAQGLHFRRMANGVDHVVAVEGELPGDALGQGARPLGLAQPPPRLDHPVAGLLDALRPQLVPEHVRERKGVEAARFQEAHDLTLAGPVEPRNPDDHLAPGYPSQGTRPLAACGGCAYSSPELRDSWAGTWCPGSRPRASR
jgi:hypothetical protein